MSYTLLSETKPKARKEHQCIWCGEPIVKGTHYINERSVFDGKMQNHHWHLECSDACKNINFDECEWEFEAYSNERPL